MYLETLTSLEFEERLSNRLVVILPIGSIEEHGPHLPLCTDVLQPIRVAELLASKGTLDILIAPAIPYGQCSSTRNFPGTISITFESLKGFVSDVLRDLHRNGIRNIVVLSGHAGRGHMAALKLAAEDLVRGLDMKIMVLSDYDIAYGIDDLDIPSGDGHAGFIETSRILAIDKGMVKGKGVTEFPEFPPFRILRHPERYFVSGVMGDPSKATAEAGVKLNQIIADRLEVLIKKMLEEPADADL